MNLAASKVLNDLNLNSLAQQDNEYSALFIILSELAANGATATYSDPYQDVLYQLRNYQNTFFYSRILQLLNTGKERRARKQG